jgi:tetratricopeptide (TPR) repeat protein
MQIVRDLLLEANPPDNLEALAAKIEELRAQSPSNTEIGRTLPYLFYRQRKYGECLAATRGFEASNLWHAGAATFRPMALHQLGQTAEAKAELEKFKRLVESQSIASYRVGWMKSFSWQRRILFFLVDQSTVQVQYREASRVILGTEEELTLAPVDFVEHAEMLGLAQTRLPKQEVHPDLVLLAGPLEPLNARIAANRSDASAYELRAHWYGARHRWSEAREDLEVAVRLQPAQLNNRELLLKLCLLLGEEKAYLQHCEQRRRQLATFNGYVQIQIIRDLCLHEEPPTDLAALATNAEEVRVESSPFTDRFRTLAYVYYRQQKYDDCLEAIQTLEANIPWRDTPWNAGTTLFRAMALHQMGQTDKAKSELQNIKSLAKSYTVTSYQGLWLDDLSWQVRIRLFLNDQLTAHILYREASRTILGTEEELEMPPIDFVENANVLGLAQATAPVNERMNGNVVFTTALDRTGRSRIGLE